MIGGVTASIPDRQARLGDIRVAVRPDAIRLFGDAGKHSLNGEVVYASFLGTEMQYTLRTPLGELFVRSDEVADPYPLGSRVGIGFADRGLAIVGTLK